MRGSGEAMTAKMTAAKSGAVFKPRIRTWRVSQATFYRSGLNEPGTKEALDAEAKEILIKVGADPEPDLQKGSVTAGPASAYFFAAVSPSTTDQQRKQS